MLVPLLLPYEAVPALILMILSSACFLAVAIEFFGTQEAKVRKDSEAAFGLEELDAKSADRARPVVHNVSAAGLTQREAAKREELEGPVMYVVN